MKTIEQFFTANTLGKSTVEYKVIRGRERFSKWLPEDCGSAWPCSLSLFAINSPLTYWNDEIVDEALSILEKDPQRTISAIVLRQQNINNGIDNLLRVYEKKFYEQSLDLSKTSDILRLANEIHPEYLLIAHHIFGNLLPLYWSILKKKGVDGKFDLPGAVDILHNLQEDLLIGGYDDKVRNAIAHGQVYFRGLGIQYGDDNYKYELNSYEFFDKFDLLWRVCVSLAAAILLFFARNECKITVKYPLSIIRILSSSFVDRQEFVINDCLSSELANRGKQLHVLVHTKNTSRNAIILDCLHFAIKLYQLGESSFSRILFDVNYENKSISGILAIDYEKLMDLLQTNASYERVGEILESTLLWYDEPIRILLFKTFFRNLRTGFSQWYWMFVSQQSKTNNLLAPDTYKIKETRNSSAGGLARLELIAIITKPSDAHDSEKIKLICKNIIRKYSLRWMEINPSKIGNRLNIYLPPSYIWIRLYKRDGTNRWLGNSGWQNTELICLSEYIRGKHHPILIKQPDIVENKIRYQFSMK